MNLLDINPWWKLEGLKDSELVREVENIIECDRELRDYAYGIIKIDSPFPEILFRREEK